MGIDKDCNSEFPHRSKVVINQKLYDDYCMKIKKCSTWKDTDRKNGKPVPWPSECKSNTIAKLPKLNLTKDCLEIKYQYAPQGLERLKEELDGYNELFTDISENYINSYAYWMKYPNDDNKKVWVAQETSWGQLKMRMEEKKAAVQNSSDDYYDKMKEMNKKMIREHTNYLNTSKNLNIEERNLLSLGGKDQKENLYNSTSGHVIKTIYYTTAIIIMGIYLTKLN
tara:strand:+ start:218 stop:892 length:675 start_codon:yes stop_codon:yes gene_type:complete